MAAHLTKAEAAALGLTGSRGSKAQKLAVPTKKSTKSTKSKMARAGAETVCATCGERFTTDAEETKHMTDTKHLRYEVPMPRHEA